LPAEEDHAAVPEHDRVVSKYSADLQALQQKVLVCVTMVAISADVNAADAVMKPR